MTACPSCFQQLPADRYAWICENAACEKLPDPVATAYIGNPVGGGNLTVEVKPPEVRRWSPMAVAHCGKCGAVSAPACPHCHYAIPADWRSVDATTIAMNGARSTGKSFYIAVAIHQLGQLLSQLGSTIEFGNDRTRDTYKTVYEEPLFEKLGLIAPTPRSNTANAPTHDPMIFSLGKLAGRQRYLVIRDVAGEEMEDAAADAQNLSFLKHADGVFFMFDPLAISEIRDRLRDLVPQQLSLGGDPKTVLGNLLRLIGNGTPKVAVIVSKFDALQALRNVNDVGWKGIMSNPGAAIQRDPSLESGAYDKNDGELLSLEVRSLLDKLGAQSFVLSLEQSSGGRGLPHRYFAVSVLGESPDGDSLSKYGISPFRIVDPLKWVLDSRGIL